MVTIDTVLLVTMATNQNGEVAALNGEGANFVLDPELQQALVSMKKKRKKGKHATTALREVAMKTAALDVLNPDREMTEARAMTKMWGGAETCRTFLNESTRHVKARKGQKVIVERPQCGQPGGSGQSRRTA